MHSQSLLSLLALTAGSQARTLGSRAADSSSSCDESSLNTTVGSYTILAGDTIQSIASATNRGACDIARANRMADATLFSTGASLLIPAEVCAPDQTSCLISSNATYTRSCVLGGPHTYTVVANDDSWDYIASKLQVATSALNTADNDSADTDGVAAPVEGDSVKLEQCDPSVCEIKPYPFTYGTFKDLAEQMNSTVGQLLGFNSGYNYSNQADPSSGPTLTVPMNCKLLSDNYTTIS